MKKIVAVFMCIVMCICTVAVPITADDTATRDVTLEESYASALKSLGLFKGVSDTNFDLKRAPTRVEALIMLIRVLGEEKAALEGDWEHPFTDVAKWADPYVGYAYETGLTKGVSATEFGNSDSTAAMYLTFMLRALGYSDVNNEDFSWDDPYSLARTAGILTDAVNIEVFWRADAVTVSFEALPAYIKNSEQTLAAKLIEAGVFTKEQYDAAMKSVGQSTGTPLTAMQISEKCAPAVFYIEVYGYNGKPTGSASGFFISEDGYAITNYHVITDSLYIVITTESGKKYEDISVVDISRENDLALLKVNSEDKFTYLEFGNSDAIKQGQNVYAIGSPRGLDNTLSQGIISNINRPIDGTPYMQISVPIDRGSSGGALIDEYGKVIAVTTAGITDNTADLNLAVPIKYAAELDKTKNEHFEVHSDTFYPGFDGVYDFGAFTGMTPVVEQALPLGFVIAYDATDAQDYDTYTAAFLVKRCVRLYAEALENNGFAFKESDKELDASLYQNENTNVIIMTDNDEERIYIVVEFIGHYYEEVPAVPDAGWYLDLGDGNYELLNGWHCYDYEWSKYYGSTEFVQGMLLYYAWLTEEGFELIDTGTNSVGEAWFDFIGNGYEIVCYLSDVAFYVEIIDEDEVVRGQLEPQTQAYQTLKNYMIANGVYSNVYNEYVTGAEVNGFDYYITYSPDEEFIYFLCDFYNAGSEASVGIFLCENGENYVRFICEYGGGVVQYDAHITRADLSSNTKLTPVNYTGTENDEAYFHNVVLSNVISTLKICEETCLKAYIGITLADLGFTAIN